MKTYLIFSLSGYFTFILKIKYITMHLNGFLKMLNPIGYVSRLE